jgi:hypothetical protein
MHLLNLCILLTLYLPLCTQVEIEGGVNATTMWAQEWEASTRVDPNTGPLVTQTINPQVHEHPTQIDVPMTSIFYVDSSQVS